ncbi:MAG: DNA mismatch repair protein MutS [Sandaracinaceae bacterium]|nr:DNA mismatch repair protein MutS [Sandaracinaceae bacterium]
MMKRKQGDSERRTPAMEQYFRAKAECPDALLFFRIGDFYELFYEDAILASQILDIALTSRQKGPDGKDIPMAGVPYHSASGYIVRLLEKGHRVAICEQMADPATVRGIVPREIVRVLSPGLAVDLEFAEEKADHWLLVLMRREGALAIAGLEIGRSVAWASEPSDWVELLAELYRLEPREILWHGLEEAMLEELGRAFPRIRIAPSPPPRFELLENAMDGSLLEGVSPLAREALAAALAYAQAAHPRATLRIESIERAGASAFLQLDETAIRNLELVRSLSGQKDGALLSAIDRSCTVLGSRLLRRRLLRPLLDLPTIRRRLDAVGVMLEHRSVRKKVRETLRALPDIERLVGRAEYGSFGPRDLGAIRQSLRTAHTLAGLLASLEGQASAALLSPPSDRLDAFREALEGTFEEELPMAIGQGSLVREGASEPIDAARRQAERGRQALLELERKEREASGIASLKIGYTRVFGYYFEVTRPNLRHVPSHFRRKQTIAGGERFTSEELEAIEREISTAEERLLSLESECFEAFRKRIVEAAPSLRRLAAWLAEVDFIAGLAELAEEENHCRPELDESTLLELEGSRHPVVERMLPKGAFVPNDIRLDAKKERMWIITGPNMAGKSTVMRQAALIVILAQMGSYVPAKKAKIGLVDRILTRIGASDDLARGRSTFMVEMVETAALLKGASERSLVILDEIGRGTATYDGMAIARAVAEYLVDRVRCRTLFATHYHELASLEEERPEFVRNYNMAAREHQGEVIFLHRLLRGSANRSYGIAVARQAGIPSEVTTRASQILAALERGSTPRKAQLALFESGDERVELGVRGKTKDATQALPASPSDWIQEQLEKIAKTIADYPLAEVSPLEAFQRLIEWQKELKAIFEKKTS